MKRNLLALFVAALLTGCGPGASRQSEFATAEAEGKPVPDSRWERLDKETWRRLDSEYGVVCYRSEYSYATMACVKINAKESGQ